MTMANTMRGGIVSLDCDFPTFLYQNTSEVFTSTNPEGARSTWQLADAERGVYEMTKGDVNPGPKLFEKSEEHGCCWFMSDEPTGEYAV